MHARQHRISLRGFITAFIAMAGVVLFAMPARAQLIVVNETFANTTMSSDWVVGGTGYTPNLTAASGIDSPGSGWLRLTSAGTAQSTFAYDANAFNGKDATIAVKFNYAAYGGNGADGITFFLARAPEVGETFAAGAYGGSLGYAQKDQNLGGDTTHAGLTGGYIGLGIDEFGNYSNPTEGRVGGEAFYKPNVSIRGPGEGYSGYEYLGGTGQLTTPISFTGASRPTGDNQRTFQIIVTATNQLTVYMQAGADAPMEALYSVDLSGYGRYDNLIMGFTGSTGGQTNIHEIQGLALTSMKARLWTNANGAGNSTWASGSNWDGTNGAIPDVGADILLNNRYVSTPQNINLGGERIIRSIQIDAPFAYTLSNSTLRFGDQGVFGPSGIFVSKGNGTGAHTIGANLVADNAIDIKNTSSSALTLSGGVDTNGQKITFGGTGGTNVNGVVSGTGSLAKIDAGNVTLNSANTYSGGTTLKAGTITVGNGAALGTGGLTLQGGTLTSSGGQSVANAITLSGNATISAITTAGALVQSGGNRTLTLNGATHSGTVSLSDNDTARTLTVGVDTDQSSTISGAIGNGGQGAGSLTKTGLGTLTLSGSSTYTGTTTVNAGTLALGASNRLSDASSLNLAGGTFALAGNSERVGNLDFGNATLDFGTPGGSNALLFSGMSGTPSGVLTVSNWEQGSDILASQNTLAAGALDSIYFVGFGAANTQSAPQTVAGYTDTWRVINPFSGSWSTWDGGSTQNSRWSTAQNWVNDGAPTWGTSARIAFAGTTRLTTDLRGNRTVNAIRFDSGAGAFSLGTGTNDGYALTFDGPNANSVAFILQNSANNQLIRTEDVVLGANLVVDTAGAGNLTISSAISGANNIIKENTGGALILSGANTYTGNTYVNAGTLQIGANNALGSSTTGATFVQNGATLALSSATAINSAEAITLSGEGVVLQPNVTAGAIRNVAGTNTLSGTLTLAGDARIQAVGGSLTITGDITSATNRSLTFGGTNNITLNNQITTGGGNVTIDSTGVVTFTGDATTANTYTGTTFVNAGTLALSKTAATTPQYTATDAIAGDLVIGDGSGAASSATVRLGLADQIDDGSAVTINADGELNINGRNEAIGSLSGNGRIDNRSATAATLTFGGTGSTTFSGTITDTTGNLSLIKANGGKITLTGDNSYVGGTTIDSGIIAVGHDRALGTGNVTIAIGGNLELTGSRSVANTLFLNGPGTLASDGAIESTDGNNILTGAITLQSDSRIMADSGSTLTINIAGVTAITGATAGQDLTFGGNGDIFVHKVIGSAIAANNIATLTKDGSGTLALSATNLYAGATTIAAGTLEARSNAALGAIGGGTTVESGATLALASATGLTIGETAVSLSGTGANDTGAVRNVSGTNTVAGAITLAGPTTVAVTGGALTFSGAIAGAAGNSLTKTGAGQLTLSGAGANTFAGNFNVNGGTVVLSKNLNVDATGNGTGTLTIGADAGDVTTATVQLGANNNQINDLTAVVVNRDGQFNLNNRQETIGSIAGAGAVALGTGTLTAGNATPKAFSGTITGAGTFVKTGAGTLSLGGTAGSNAIAPGTLTVNQGTVELGNANLISDSTTLRLSGGTFAVDGNFNETIGTLSLTANSTLDFRSNTSELTFTNAGRTGGTLTIANWAGNPFGDGNSQLIFTNAATGFTGGTVMNEISFAGYGAGAVRLAGGEIVPNTGGGIFVWALATGGNWESTANWSPTGAPVGVGDTAILSNGTGGASTISLNGADRRLGYLTIDSTKSYSVTGNNLIFDVNSGTSQLINNNTGSSTISSGLRLNDNLAITQNGTGNLLISGAVTNYDANARNLTVTVHNDDGNPATGTVTISGNIQTTTGSLTKNGAGTLTLSGTNTYTGGTTINAGTIAVAADAGLGGATGGLTLNSGTLQTTASFGLSSSRAVTIGATGGTFDTAASTVLTYNGNLAGTGALTKTGGGTFVSGGAGANGFSGALTISGGVFEVAKTAAVSGVGDAAAVTVGAGATLRFNGTGAYAAETIGSLEGAGTVTNLGAGSLALTTGGNNATTLFSGSIQNTGGALALTKTGSGKLTLTGANSYTGATTVSQGVLNIQNASGLGATSAGTSVTAGAALQFEGGIAVGAEALTLNGTGVATDGALRSISGSNSLAGAITLGSAASIHTDAGSLSLTGTIASNGTARALTFGGAGNTTVSGVIGSATAGNNVTTLTKNGTGRLTLSGSNLHSGLTEVNAGTLEIQHGNALGATGTGTIVANNATLALSGGISTAESPIQISGVGDGSGGALRSLSGLNTVTGAVTLGASSLVGVDAGRLTITGVVSGTGTTLTKVGAGTLALTNINSFGSTVISGGTVEVNADNRLGTLPGAATPGNITLNGGTLATTYTGALGTNRGVALGSAGGTIETTGASVLTYGGIIAGTGSLTKSGTGSLTLTAANSYTGATILQGGTLNINADNRLGTVPGSATANQITFDGGTLATNFNGAIDSNRGITVDAGGGRLQVATGTSLSFGGTIAGTGALDLSLTGATLTLLSDINFSQGTLNLSGGTLALAGINLNVGTFHITGSTTLDFAGASNLTATNFIVDAGATVTITNWTNLSDAFLADHWWTDASRTSEVPFNLRGTAPQNYIQFTGYSNNATSWVPYDSSLAQITPVPEPRTYGAIFLGACLAFLGWRRWKQRPVTIG